MKRLGTLILLIGALSSAVMTGCGADANKAVVAGTVTYQGNPIEKGQIRFIPAADSNLPMAAALIADGEYRLDRNGGVPQGTYKVSIEAYRVPAKYAQLLKAGKTLGAETPQEQYLPDKFNRATTLTINIDANSGSAANNFNLTN